MIANLAPLIVPMMPSWLDPQHMIQAAGASALWLVALIVFVECGLAMFFLPGDSLLFAMGLFCAVGINSPEPLVQYGSQTQTILIVLVVLTLCAIAGNICGYWIGRAVGPALFKERPGLIGKIFSPKHVETTHAFFTKHGAMALILARFVPIVRTFVTMVAGVGKMDFKKYISYTAIGGVLWVVIATLAGFFLGQIPVIRNNFELVCLLIIFISVLPMVFEYLKHRKQAKADAAS